MALIPIGNSGDIPVGQNPGIEIPTVITPPTAVVVLGSTRFIEVAPTGSDAADSHWYRTAGLLRPNIATDAVVIGYTALVSDELLRTQAINATAYRLGDDAISIYTDGSDIIFSSIASGTVSLSTLLIRASQAAYVSVTDAGDYFNGANVEAVLQEVGLSIQNIESTSTVLEARITATEIVANAAASLQHPAVTIGVNANGLSTDNTQVLELAIADTSTTGALSDTDWNTFNDKLDTTDTLDAIKSVPLSVGSLIVGVSTTQAEELLIGSANQILAVNATADGLEWIANTGGGSGLFEVPTGYTSIVNEIGGINNTDYPTVTDLNNLTLLEVLQEMLFPTPDAPTFIIPSTTLTVTGVTSTGNYVEKGSTFSTSISRVFNANSSPAHSVEDAARYLLGGVVFTSPTSVLFNANKTFSTESDYSANMAYAYSMPDGSTIYPDSFVGYASGTATANRVFTVVDPIYYGAITAASTTYPTAPTEIDVKTATKLVGPEQTLTISVPTYTGAVDTKKFILIAFPDSYGTLSQILYVQGGNTNVLGSFNSTTFTYTEPDLSTTVTYRLYYALNSYNSGGTVTYTIYF